MSDIQTASPREVRTDEQAAQEDVFFGQTVIIWARWSVIVAGTALSIWTSRDPGTLTRTIPFFLALIAMNFFLHGRYVMGSPLNRTAVIGASLVDLVLITAIVAFWPNEQNGINSGLFVLYYPVVFAFALVLPRPIEAAYTALAAAAYAVTCLVETPQVLLLGEPSKVLVMRLVVLAAMGFLGNYYFRIQRDRLRRASTGAVSAMEELRLRVEAQARPGARPRRAG